MKPFDRPLDLRWPHRPVLAIVGKDRVVEVERCESRRIARVKMLEEQLRSLLGGR
jgi:hypothetical protein